MYKLNYLLFASEIIAALCIYEQKNSDFAKILHRPIRALSYPESSNMGIFFALAVPLPDPSKSVSVSYFFEATYSLPENSTVFAPWSEGLRRKRSIDRKTIYQTMENKLKSFGFSGRSCLLRSICETLKFDLSDNGVIGDIINVILTPSTSQQENLPQDIVEAELIGQTRNCTKYHWNCPVGLLDLIGILV
ncbi:uncharacterized protein LOC123260390 [Cotesia glomerata]|uniref:uncharacterized protein LOC123260390 n=1 Tax=Cotesia glomerata TaxID=32391 RepID=UPI001D031106|nr:uncharacterized protein LOC123260390 [Cotesia glomerata]